MHLLGGKLAIHQMLLLLEVMLLLLLLLSVVLAIVAEAIVMMIRSLTKRWHRWRWNKGR